MFKETFSKVTVWLFLMSFLIRIGCSELTCFHIAGQDLIPSLTAQSLDEDSYEYAVMGKSLADTGSYRVPEDFIKQRWDVGGAVDTPFMLRSPAFPGFLALHYKIFGYDQFYPRLSGLILSSLQAPIIYLIGVMVVSRRVGLIASFIWSIWLPSIIYSTWLWTETIVCTSFLFSLWMQLRSFNKNGVDSCFQFVPGNLLLGYLILLRPYFAAVAFVSPVILYFAKINCDKKKILIGFLVMVSMPAAWFSRNMIYGVPTISTDAVSAVFVGNTPLSRGSIPHELGASHINKVHDYLQKIGYFIQFPADARLLFSPVPDKATFDLVYRIQAFHKRNHLKSPFSKPVLFVRKVLCLLLPWDDNVPFQYATALWTLVLACSLPGAIMLLSRVVFPKFALLAAPVFVILLASMIAFGLPRFRFPVEPLFVIFASVFFGFIIDKLTPEREKGEPPQDWRTPIRTLS